MSWYDIHEPIETELLVGFYDLTGFARFCRGEHERRILDLMSAYFDLTGRIIEDANGVLVKTIGDAGLAAFPHTEVDRGVLAFCSVKSAGDSWLAEQGVKSAARVKLNYGPVACGLVGAPGRQKFDIYGHTVNTAATLDAGRFAMTPQVFRKLSSETRKLFKKHTPPVTYIALDDWHEFPRR